MHQTPLERELDQAAINVLIIRRNLELHEFDGQTCPHCKNAWEKHSALACGWWPGTPDPTLPVITKALKQREYGVIPCERCHKPFMRRVSNARFCVPCRDWRRTHRHG